MFLRGVKVVCFLSVLESESGVGVVFVFGGSIFYKLGLHCFGIVVVFSDVLESKLQPYNLEVGVAGAGVGV